MMAEELISFRKHFWPSRFPIEARVHEFGSFGPSRTLITQKKPRHAWLTPPGSDADQETATFPSCVLLPSMGYDMRVETG